jgi:hypothetical protein
MNFWDLFYVIPGAVTLSVILASFLPFSLDKGMNPSLIFLSALLCVFLPVQVTVALAIAVPVGLVHGWTGVRLQEHEPVKVNFGKARSLAAFLRGKVRHRQAATVRQVLTREYPEPGVVEAKTISKYVPVL